MKILLDYDETTGAVSGKDGTIIVSWLNLKGFDIVNKNTTLDLIKQGVTPDEIIKLKNNDLI